MLVMFTFGVMVVLSLFVVAERSLPPGPWSARLPGVVLVAWGIWTLVRAAPIR